MASGERIRQLRQSKSLTVTQLSEMSGVSQPYLWQLENYPEKEPSAKILYMIASALGTTVTDLLGLPSEISSAALKDLPKSLQTFIRKNRKRLDIREEDVRMLANINFRGRQPQTKEDWELLYLFIRRLLG